MDALWVPMIIKGCPIKSKAEPEIPGWAEQRKNEGSQGSVKMSGVPIYFFSEIIGVNYSLLYNNISATLHLVLGSCIFLGLVKICRSQIHSTEVINNQKRMSEGIPSLM